MSAPRTIALATADKFSDLVPDDLLLADALGARERTVVAAIWNDPAQRWNDYEAVVIRSCWDYHLAHDAFLAWITQLETTGVIDAAGRAIVAAERGRARSLYARVDGCVISGRFVLMEIELIEPDLFLRANVAAPARLADALLARIGER